MKQLFAIFVMVFMTLGVNAQNSNVIAEKDWTGCTEDDLLWYQFGDGQQGSVTATDDGIAISIPTKSEVPYEPQTTIIDNFSLVEGHSYVVRITVKIPSDGQLQVNMGDWNGNEQDFFDVTGSEDFQELEIEFPNYPYTINSEAHILFQSGFIVGTCVVKKVQVIDKEVMQSSTPTITANAITIEAGGEADLVMTYESENDMTGAQFTITLPDGITIKKNDDEYVATLGKEIKQNYTWNIFDGSAGIIVIVSRKSATVTALTSGIDLITLTLVADETAVSGNAKISGITFSDKGTSVSGNEDFEIAITVPGPPEPYAVLSDNNTVLTFYYDNQKAARNGMDVGPFSSTLDFDQQKWIFGAGWDEQRENITDVVFDASFANCTTLTSTAYWIYGCTKLTTITGINNLKTDNVTSMAGMFAGCSSLTSLDISGFNTANVADMQYMFSNCSKLVSLDASNFNTGNVTDMTGMFYHCSSLTDLNVSGFKNDNVLNMYCMFQGCYALTNLDLSGFKTEKVTNMSAMFESCYSLTGLDLSEFNTSNVTNMELMFNNCSSLKNLNVSGFKTDNVTTTNSLFEGCSSLTNLDVSNFKTDNVTYMGNMFNGCSGLTSLDVSGFNTAKVTFMGWMFNGCSGLTSLDVNNFKTDNVTDMRYMFSGCSGLKTIYAGEGWSTTAITDGENMFKDCTNLIGGAGTSYDANHTDYTYAHIDGGTANPGYFTAAGAEPWTEPNEPEPYAVLSNNNTVLTFYYDEKKEERNGMDVGPFEYNEDTGVNSGWYGQRESITNVVFDASFADCTTLTSTAHWFYDCDHLTTITGISNLKTDNVTSMHAMFYGCSDLTNLDVSNFKTDNVMDMWSMFYDCSGLTSLDLSNFKTDNVTNMSAMFWNCSGLKTIYVGSGWTTAAVIDEAVMFFACTSLVGGAGTHYDANHTNHSYAHIDGGTANPGYLTAAGAEPWTEPDINAVVLTGKINNYWYDATGTSNNGFESIIFTIPAPTNDPNAYDTSVWENSVLMTFVNNQLAFTTVDGIEINNVTGQILFESKGNMVTTDDGKTLRYVNGNEQGEVATIEPTSGMIHIVNSETTRRLLNKPDAEFMAMPVCVKAYINDQAVTVTNGSFTVFARKPLKAEGKAVQVASLDEGTNTFELIDLVKISDWRGIELKSSTNIDLFEYYRVKSITVSGASGNADVSNLVKTDLGSQDGSFGPLPSTYSVTQAPTELQKKSNGNNIVTDSYGTLSIQNNGDAIIDGYSLQIPLTITYEWGSIEVVTTINQEQGQIPVQDPEPYAVLSDNNTVLTFYYDENKEERNGMDVGPFTLTYDQERNREVINSGWDEQRDNITKVVFDDSFADCTSITSTAYWFYEFRKSLTTITGIRNLNTANVTDMSDMFYYCAKLESLDVSGFNTANVTSMRGLFMGCNNLTSLDVSNFNTANVTDMQSMFFSCRSLTSLDLTNFNTANVTNMHQMFVYCSNLTSLDVSNFNTANVYAMSRMFEQCKSLTSLDLSNFNTENVTHIYNMFERSSNLRTIYVGSKWTTEKVSRGDEMFTECTSLIGGAGTHYDANHIDHTYAHIDGGTANPGYFTESGAKPWTGPEPVIVSLINNGDMEGNENSNFFVRYEAMGDQFKEVSKATITNGVGVNGSRGVKVEAKAKMVEKWDNQFWFRLNQPVSAGTKVRLSFDYRTDTEATITTESHEEPTVYIYYNPFGGDINFSKDWSHFEYEGTMDSNNSTDQLPFQSMAFTLNSYYEEPNNYYFDNIKFEVIMEDQCPKPTFKKTDNTVTIQSPFDATIYYTLDGKEPTTNSSVYTAPLSFTQSATIMAIAVVDGYEVSPVATYLFEPAEDNLDQKREELIAMIYQLMQEADVCRKELGMKDPEQATYMWKDLDAIDNEIAIARMRTEEATTEEELDYCKEYAYEIAYEMDRLRKEIEMYAPINVSFDGLTAWVSGGATLDDAFAEAGGREVAARTIAAIIWESTTALTADMLQGIDNPNLLVYVNEASLAPQGIQNVVINGQAKEIILTDAATGNNNFFCPQPFRVEKISYTRNFSQQTEVGVSQGWEGIALPFNVQSITHETKGAIAPFGTGTGVKHFWLRTLSRNGMTSATSIEAYKPYVISMPNNTTVYPQEYNLDGDITFSAMNVDVPETPETERISANNGNYTMVSAFQAVAQSDSIYAINVGQARANYAEGSVFEAGLRKVRPFEVYTVHNGQGARPRFMPIQGNSDTMSIENIENEFSTLNSKWYDLNGRKLSTEPKRKGIYIQNGRQQIVR